MTPQLDSALASDFRALADLASRLARRLESGLADLPDSEPSATVKPTAPFAELLGARELAALLAINARTLRRWKQEGRIPKPLRGKGPPRWRRSAIDQWLEDQAA